MQKQVYAFAGVVEMLTTFAKAFPGSSVLFAWLRGLKFGV